MIRGLISKNLEETIKKLQKLDEKKRGIRIIDSHGKEITIEYTNSEDIDEIKTWKEVERFYIDRNEAFTKPSNEGTKYGLYR